MKSKTGRAEGHFTVDDGEIMIQDILYKRTKKGLSPDGLKRESFPFRILPPGSFTIIGIAADIDPIPGGSVDTLGDIFTGSWKLTLKEKLLDKGNIGELLEGIPFGPRVPRKLKSPIERKLGDPIPDVKVDIEWKKKLKTGTSPFKMTVYLICNRMSD